MKELHAFSAMAKAMEGKPLHDALKAAVKSGTDITGCARCCIILAYKHNKLMLAAGHPEHEHGIGKELAKEHGGNFLHDIMNGHRTIFVPNPTHDARTSYLKELAQYHHIASIIFVPLVSKEESIGIMVFDFTENGRAQIESAKIIGDYITFVIETSHRKERERKKVAQKEKLSLLGEKYALVAHEVRNTLTIIGGHANHLSRAHFLEENNKRHAKRVFEEINRLERVMANVLNFSKFAPQQLNPSTNSLIGFITNCLREIRIAHPALHTHLLCRSSRDVTVCFDKAMLQTCLYDLFKNARDAGAKNVWVKPKIKAAKKMVLISISNDGKEIPEKDLPDIFDPFFTTKENGSGLGLALAQAIIEGHGGIITAENRIKKRGEKRITRTIFKIHLPL